MGKSRKKKEKRADFQKVKFKVGKTLPKAANETDISFKTRRVHIKEQLKSGPTSEPSTRKKQTLTDLFAHSHHHNVSFRHDAVTGIREIMQENPHLIQVHLSSLIENVSERFVDKDPAVRQAVMRLLKVILPKIPASRIGPFFPVISAHVCCAMTHIYEDIQLDSLLILDLLLEHFPALTSSGGNAILNNFLEQISRQQKSGKTTTGGEMKRSLSINPNSKLSSQKWRVKVLQRLHKFLKSLVEQVEVKHTGVQLSSQDILWSEKKATYVQPFGVGSVNSYQGTGFQLSKSAAAVGAGPGGKGVDIVRNGAELKKFIEVLMPLLMDCWSESSPALIAHDMHRNALTAESLHVVSCVLSVVQLLWQCVEYTAQDSEQITVSWLRETFSRDIYSYFMSYFPYSQHEDVQPAKKRKTGKGSLPQVSLVNLNLVVCDITTFLSSSNHGEGLDRWLSDVILFLRDAIADTRARLTVDQLKLALVSTRRILVLLDQHDNFSVAYSSSVKQLVSAIHQAYKTSHSNSTEKSLLLEFFTEIVLSLEYTSPAEFDAARDWLKELPKLLYGLPGASPAQGALWLNVVKLAANQGDASFTDMLQRHLPGILKKSTQGGAGGLMVAPSSQRRLLELIFSTKSSKSQFELLASLCHERKIHTDNLNFLLQLLHHRHVREVNGSVEASHKVELTSDYLSFIISLIIGFQKSKLDALNVDSEGSHEVQGHSGKFKVVAEGNDKREHHAQLVKSACSVLDQYPVNAALLLQKVLVPCLRNFMAQYSTLPVLTATSILQLVSSTLDQKVAPLLCCHLVPLSGTLLQHAVACMESDSAESRDNGREIQLVSLDLLKWSGVLADQFLEESCKEMLGCSSQDTLRPLVKALTAVLQESGIRETVRNKRALLQSTVNTAQDLHGGDIDGQWWADFKYELSLVK